MLPARYVGEFHPGIGGEALANFVRDYSRHFPFSVELLNAGEIQPGLAARRRTKGRALQEVSKEVVGIHALLTRSLFACDILRRFLRRVPLAKSISAPLRF
jgi:hypothetical protein